MHVVMCRCVFLFRNSKLKLPSCRALSSDGMWELGALEGSQRKEQRKFTFYNAFNVLQSSFLAGLPAALAAFLFLMPFILFISPLSLVTLSSLSFDSI